MTMNTEQWQH